MHQERSCKIAENLSARGILSCSLTARHDEFVRKRQTRCDASNTRLKVLSNSIVTPNSNPIFLDSASHLDDGILGQQIR
jgi:hypothetical protein